MKHKYLPCTFLCLTLMLFSCNRSRQTPENIATDFLKAYLATDYAEAAQYCSPDAGTFLLDCVKEFETLPEEIREEMRRQAAAISPTLLQTQTLSKDSVIITYCLQLDSLHHADGTMTLTRDQDKNWFIQSW